LLGAADGGAAGALSWTCGSGLLGAGAGALAGALSWTCGNGLLGAGAGALAGALSWTCGNGLLGAGGGTLPLVGTPDGAEGAPLLCGGVDTRPAPEAGVLLSIRRGWVWTGAVFGVDRCSTGTEGVTRPGWTVPAGLDDGLVRTGGVASGRPTPGRAVVGAAGLDVVTRLGGVTPVLFEGSESRDGVVPPVRELLGVDTTTGPPPGCSPPERGETAGPPPDACRSGRGNGAPTLEAASAEPQAPGPPEPRSGRRTSALCRETGCSDALRGLADGCGR